MGITAASDIDRNNVDPVQTFLNQLVHLYGDKAFLDEAQFLKLSEAHFSQGPGKRKVLALLIQKGVPKYLMSWKGVDEGPTKASAEQVRDILVTKLFDANVASREALHWGVSALLSVIIDRDDLYPTLRELAQHNKTSADSSRPTNAYAERKRESLRSASSVEKGQHATDIPPFKAHVSYVDQTADQSGDVMIEAASNSLLLVRGIGLLLVLVAAVLAVFKYDDSIVVVVVALLIPALPLLLAVEKLSTVLERMFDSFADHIEAKLAEEWRFGIAEWLDRKIANVHVRASVKLTLLVIFGSIFIFIWLMILAMRYGPSGTGSVNSDGNSNRSSSTNEKLTSEVSKQAIAIDQFLIADYDASTNTLKITPPGHFSSIERSCSQFIFPGQNKVFSWPVKGDEVWVLYGGMSSPRPTHFSVFSSSQYVWIRQGVL